MGVPPGEPPFENRRVPPLLSIQNHEPALLGKSSIEPVTLPPVPSVIVPFTFAVLPLTLMTPFPEGGACVGPVNAATIWIAKRAAAKAPKIATANMTVRGRRNNEYCRSMVFSVAYQNTTAMGIKVLRWICGLTGSMPR